MIDNTKYFIYDPLGVNTFWCRFYNKDKLEIIDTYNENIVKEIVKKNNFLLFASVDAFKILKKSHYYTNDLQDKTKLIEDFPDLLSLGFEQYSYYKDIHSVSGIEIIGDKQNINIDDITYIYGIQQTKKKKIISIGGKINGNKFFLKNSELNIIVGEKSELVLGKNCRIGDNVKIILEKNCYAKLGDNCCLTDGTILYLRNSSTVIIGNNNTLPRVSINAFYNISIGDNCLFARDVYFRDGDGHDIFGLEKPNYPAKISIGNNVWVASKVTILKNSHIADNCIVGIGSIVSKPFKSNSLIAGVPSRIIKENISWHADYSCYRDMHKVERTCNGPFI